MNGWFVLADYVLVILGLVEIVGCIERRVACTES